MTDETVRAILVQAIITAPATIASIAALWGVWLNRTERKASELRTENKLEQIRSSSSLTTDRVGQLVNGVNDMGRKVTELSKK